VANGYLHIHLSVNDNADTCYIFVNDIYNETLVMRYLVSMHCHAIFCQHARRHEIH
jgi:hypothetical protein